MRHRLIGREAYRTFRLLDFTVAKVRTGQRLARRIKGFVARRGRQVVGQIYYRAQLRMPLDESLALYAAYWYRGRSCNPAAIADKAEELVPGIRNVWVVTPGRVGSLPPGTDYVVAGSLPYYRAIARARYLVNNVNWPNRLRKRRGSTHVMTHHGTPLKKMGADQADHPAGAVRDPDFGRQMRRADRWDFSVSANAHTSIAWDSAYPVKARTLEVGYPRNDRLALATPADVAAAREKLGLPADCRVVLYMPTHREWLPKDRPVLDVERFAEELGPDTVLLVRGHYFSAPEALNGEVPEGSGRIIDVAGHPVVEELYLAADALVTDYSSAMFDYAVLDRPVVVYTPDWQVYRELRGTYFDLMAEPPGAVATDPAGLAEVFRSGAYDGEDAKRARAAFRARFCYLDDGGAAERVVRRVFLNEKV